MLVRPSDSVLTIKQKLVERGVANDVSVIRLLLKGRALKNTQSVEACELTTGATLHATLTKGAAVPAQTPMTETANTATTSTTTATPSSPMAVLDQVSFWNDLQGFLQTRLSDHAATEEVLTLFRNAWKSSPHTRNFEALD
jgi:hypothetical protein